MCLRDRFFFLQRLACCAIHVSVIVGNDKKMEVPGYQETLRDCELRSDAISSAGNVAYPPESLHLTLVILYASGEYQFALPPRPGGQCA